MQGVEILATGIPISFPNAILSMKLLSEKLNLKMLVANLYINCFNTHKSFTLPTKCIHLLVWFTE
jgi:hypothetical protein